MGVIKNNFNLNLVGRLNLDALNPFFDGECFRIASVDDSYRSTGKVYVKVLVVGTGKVFDKSVHEIFYNDKWLKRFPKEDVARIAYLHAAEIEKKLDLIDSGVSRIVWPKTNNLLTISIIYTACLILSNIAALKVSTIHGYEIPSGLIFFPFTYIFDDILTEVYGFQASRRVIWLALLANLIITAGMQWVVSLTPSSYWPHQEAFSQIFAVSPKIFLASVLSYLFGEFVNSILIAKLKILTSGKYLWLRLVGSTICGVSIESTLFGFLAWYTVLPNHVILRMIALQFCFKVGYEIFTLPATYKIVNYLKKTDKIDYYDINTNFNPFSLKMDG